MNATLGLANGIFPVDSVYEAMIVALCQLEDLFLKINFAKAIILVTTGVLFLTVLRLPPFVNFKNFFQDQRHQTEFEKVFSCRPNTARFYNLKIFAKDLKELLGPPVGSAASDFKTLSAYSGFFRYQSW